MKWLLSIIIMLLVSFITLTTFTNLQARKFIVHGREVRQSDKDTSEAIANISQIQSDLDKFSEQMKVLHAAFFGPEELAPYLTAEAAKQGITLKIETPPAPEGAAVVKEVPMTATLTGPSYNAVTKFLTAIESGKAAIKITKLTLSSPKGATDAVSATMEMLGQVR